MSGAHSVRNGCQRSSETCPRKFVELRNVTKCHFADPDRRETISFSSRDRKSETGGRLAMFATIYLPNFYLQAATRHQPALGAKPVALIEEQERKPLIIQLNALAKQFGIRKGMTPSQALARCLQVIIKVRSGSQEKSIQETLLHYAFTLSPFVE